MTARQSATPKIAIMDKRYVCYDAGGWYRQQYVIVLSTG